MTATEIANELSAARREHAADLAQRSMLDGRAAARVVAITASDGSIFANIRYVTDDGYAIEFGCVDENSAERLADCLNDLSWGNVSSVPA